LDDDLVCGLRDEIPLRHFKLIFSKRASAGQELIPSASGEDDEIRFARFAIDRVTRLVEGCIDLVDAIGMNAAAGIARAIEQQAIQNSARIDNDRMLKIKMRAVILSADDFDVANEFFGKVIVEKERVALRCFVSEAPAARFFPSEMLIVNID